MYLLRLALNLEYDKNIRVNKYELWLNASEYHGNERVYTLSVKLYTAF